MTKKLLALALTFACCTLYAQQVPNANFEDWSAEEFNKAPQPNYWHASNVCQFGLKFNFANQEKGHTGNYSLMVQDLDVGAMGIKETSPGYFSLGQPWVFIESLFKVKQATAGTYGGIKWTYLPDTMSVWIRRTGDNVDKEDFYLLYYAWKGTAQSSHYKAKNGTCTAVTFVNEESDIRQALDGNECGTDQLAEQVAEGMWREKKEYKEWTNIRVPIYYMSNNAPEMMNLIFSASNYPNFRANTGLYAGNSLYIDDIQFIYSAHIDRLLIDGKPFEGFDPNSTAVQTCQLSKGADMPKHITAIRGVGKLTNAHGETASFHGRTLRGKEIEIIPGEMNTKPTIIRVHAQDHSSSRTYTIQFVN